MTMADYEHLSGRDSQDMNGLVKKYGGIFFLFLFISLLMQYFHEPWRDEAQAWLIARDNDFFSIFKITAYNGAPCLWYTILHVVSELGLPYSTMGLIHVAIVSAIILLILIKSPFSWPVKAVLPFSYYFIYEYNVIARNYSLSVLIIFIIASIYHKRRQKGVAYSVLLFLLMQTNVHGLIIALSLLFFDVIELVFQRDKYPDESKWFIIIPVIGLIFVVYQLYPPDDLMHKTKLWMPLTKQSLASWSVVVNNAFFPYTFKKLNFWNRNSLYEVRHFAYALAVLIFPVTIFLLYRIKNASKATFIYILSCIGLFSIFLFKYMGFMRHHGFVLIMFVFSIWIIKSRDLEKDEKRIRTAEIFLGVIVAAQILSGGWAIYTDIRHPFSQTKNAAKYLLKEDMVNNDAFIAIYDPWKMMPILPYLPPEISFYRLTTRDYGTYISDTREYELNRILSTDEIIKRFETEIKRRNLSQGLFITEKAIDDEIWNNKFYLVASFEGAIIIGENIFIYKYYP